MEREQCPGFVRSASVCTRNDFNQGERICYCGQGWLGTQCDFPCAGGGFTNLPDQTTFLCGQFSAAGDEVRGENWNVRGAVPIGALEKTELTGGTWILR